MKSFEPKETFLLCMQIFLFVIIVSLEFRTADANTLLLVILIVLTLVCAGFRVYLREIRYKAAERALKAGAESAQSAHRMASQLDIAVRREIGLWIHGTLQSELMSIIRSLRQNGEVEAAHKLMEINDMTVRAMAHKLYPPQLEITLHLALSDLCHKRADLMLSDNLSLKSFKALQSVVLPFQVRLAVYRIVEEAITNAEKKMNTTHIFVSVTCEDEIVHISIFDNGSALKDPIHHSLGLALINSHVKQFDGDWSIRNSDNGVLLTAKLAIPGVQTLEMMVPASFRSLNKLAQ